MDREEMDLLFSANTPWNWDAERNFARIKEQNPQLVQGARAGSISITADVLQSIQDKNPEKDVEVGSSLDQRI